MQQQHIYFDNIQSKIIVITGLIDDDYNSRYDFLTTISYETETEFAMKLGFFIDGFMLGNEMTNNFDFVFDETEDIIYCDPKDIDEHFVIGNEIVCYNDIEIETPQVNDLLSELNIGTL